MNYCPKRKPLIIKIVPPFPIVGNPAGGYLDKSDSDMIKNIENPNLELFLCKNIVE